MVSGGSSSIEVERKFFLNSADTLQQRVAEHGGDSLGVVSFTDSYWDTDDCTLTRRDTWLRQRDGQWELKLPVEDARRSGGERSVFREIEQAPAVAAALESLLTGWTSSDVVDAASGDCNVRLESSLREAALAPFATFTTTRSKLRLGKCSIDADVADFGHSVLEIEVMCADQGEVVAAEAEIARVAHLIGAEPLGPQSGGKLETYIRRHCPSVLANLVEAGVLQPANL
jgi:thiamine-triphosphatase